MKTIEMTDRLHGWKERAGETAKNMGAAAGRYVRDNTWSTLAVALTLGCVVGFLVGNRRH